MTSYCHGNWQGSEDENYKLQKQSLKTCSMAKATTEAQKGQVLWRSSWCPGKVLPGMRKPVEWPRETEIHRILARWLAPSTTPPLLKKAIFFAEFRWSPILSFLTCFWHYLVGSNGTCGSSIWVCFTKQYHGVCRRVGRLVIGVVE